MPETTVIDAISCGYLAGHEASRILPTVIARPTRCSASGWIPRQTCLQFTAAIDDEPPGEDGESRTSIGTKATQR
jgi:hypothetical protein